MIECASERAAVVGRHGGTRTPRVVRVDPPAGGENLPGLSIQLPNGRWSVIHNPRDPLAEAERAVAPAFAAGVPGRVICVGLGLGYVLDAIERWSDATSVLALEPMPESLEPMMARRDWRAWTDTGRLAIVCGPGYEEARGAWERLRGGDGASAEPVVVVQQRLAKILPKEVGEAEWLAQRLLGMAVPETPEPLRRAASTEELLTSLPRPIALVGNAEVFYPLGVRIDSYPTVIRFNNYRIRGFEDRVGRRTTVRCVNGWIDVEHRNELVEFTPFTPGALESGNLAVYSAANAYPVLTARMDVKPLLTGMPKPSTGLALARLLHELGVEVDLFAFDGFRSGHYWERGRLLNPHASTELETMLDECGFVLYGDIVDYRGLYVEGAPRPDPNGIMKRLEAAPGGRVLEVRAGDDRLTSWLVGRGHDVTVVEVANVERPPDSPLIIGLPSLASLEPPFDRVVVNGLLAELVPNDAALLLKEASRLASELVTAVPTGSGGPGARTRAELERMARRHYREVRTADDGVCLLLTASR